MTYEVDIARRPSTAVAAERAAILLLSIAIAIATFARTGGTLDQRCSRHPEIPLGNPGQFGAPHLDPSENCGADRKSD